MSRVLVVGCGCTGSLISALIKRSPSFGGVSVVLWDKARGAGGRMATSRSPKNAACLADLGCQYITQHSSYGESHSRYYNELIENHVLAPLQTEIAGMTTCPSNDRHYVTPGGVSSLVKYFLKESDCVAEYGKHVSEIAKIDQSWHVLTKDGARAEFDAVVVTIPVPQILSLQGDIQTMIDADPELKANLQTVDYSSRYALGLFFDENVKLEEDWTGKYITNHPIFRFVAIDNRKRNQGDAAPAVVFHTSVPFGKANIDKDPAEVEPILLAAVRELFPHWPTASSVKLQKWRYSQVSQPYPGAPGCVVISEKPLLILAGDGFVHSNFDGCIESAEAVLREFNKRR